MVAEGDKQVEEQLAASVEHLSLHGAAALEGIAAADDKGEEVGAQLGIVVRGVGVCVSGGQEDGVACNASACRYEM